MKIPLLLGAALLAVSACTPQSTEPPAEVLQKSALANQSIESASFSIESTFQMMSAFLGGQSEGGLRANGLLQNGGKQLAFSVTAEGTTSVQKTPWAIEADVTIPSEQEIYVRIRDANANATLSPAVSVLQKIEGGWFSLPNQINAPVAPVTPDPSMLRMQAEVIDVVEDKGFDFIGGHRSHHYVVTVNSDKLVNFIRQISAQRGEEFDEASLRQTIAPLTINGDIWIDAKTYCIRRVNWTISSSSMTQPMKMTIHADIIDAPGAQRIVPPADWQPLPSGDMLPIPTEPSFTP